MSLPASLSSALGILFVLLGTAAVWMIFDASRRSHSPAARERVLRAHRVAGYLFIALFGFMCWTMIARLQGNAGELSPGSMFHVALVLVLAPLLFVKVLIARHYKSYSGALVPLGLSIFTLAFVLVGSVAGPFLIRSFTVNRLPHREAAGQGNLDLTAAGELMQRRCSRCHTLDRVAGARKDAAGWSETVQRMQSLPGSEITDADTKTVLAYLIAENSIDSSSPQGARSVGQALVDSHCARCHNLDRVYQSRKSPADWSETVDRMVDYARGTDGFFKPGESARIVQFLAATQAPGNPGPAAEGPPPSREKPGAAPGIASSKMATFGLAALMIAGLGTLMLRRPKHSPAEVAAPKLPAAGQSLLLQLVRTDRQTHDCVSLRFRLAASDYFRAKPGQFLTFDWLVDGKKLVRSYSISSSPSQTGFVEITVKKSPQGLVSAFLNDRVPAGLTVQARGPSGHFYFDEAEHESIVLIGGGSGITPLMSILRYIDDRCLDTQVTLFYSVSTRHDIIFEEELARLEERISKFQRIVVVTKPDPGWHGPAGFLTREMLLDHVPAPSNHRFFVCGPPAFMNHVDSTLSALGVDPEQIFKEQFAGSPAAPPQARVEAAAGLIEFARSGKSCAAPAGRTLLEAAEANGVALPSGCRQGQCGTCATRVLAGDVEMEREDGLDPALKAQGYVLCCVGRPLGNVRLDA